MVMMMKMIAIQFRPMYAIVEPVSVAYTITKNGLSVPVLPRRRLDVSTARNTDITVSAGSFLCRRSVSTKTRRCGSI